MNSIFKRASREAVFLKLAITGPSGSGKTTAALRLARGLVGSKGKVAVVDTENSSSLLYSDRFEFDVCVIEPPFSEDKFSDAVNSAIVSKYDCIIMDSFSHLWQAILDYKSKLDARGGNSYLNWASAGAKFENVLQAILHGKIHVICCMRSKMDYIMEVNDKGKTAPKKVGLAPIMRDGIEFEFSVVLDLDMNHKAMASKDRTRLFDGKIIEVTEDVGTALNDWRNGKDANVQDVLLSGNPTLAKSATVQKTSDDEVPMNFADDLKSIVEASEDAVNYALQSWNWIIPNQTWRDLKPQQVEEILSRPQAFLEKAKELFSQMKGDAK